MSLKYIDENGNEKDIAGIGKKTEVSVSQTITSGTEIGKITVDGIEKKLFTPTIPTKVFYEAWSPSITFYCDLGHHALIICSFGAMYLLWNPSDSIQTVSIFGSGYNFVRDNNDKTKITLSKSDGGSSTFTILVF